MLQILFVIPLHDWTGIGWVPNVPIYGYGLMLFFAYILCTALGKYLCKREGIDAQIIPDLAIWLFLGGIVGGRIVFVVQYWHPSFDSPDYAPLWDGVIGLLAVLAGIGIVLAAYLFLYKRNRRVPFFAVALLVLVGVRVVYVWFWKPFFASNFAKIVYLWDGGLVLYGSVAGAVIAYFAYDYFVLRKLNVPVWKMMDVAAPCIALGIALGRIGCLCTGCCYGNVACEGNCPALHFPIGSPAWLDMVQRGYQTPQGFLLDGRSLSVAIVEPESPAANAGLRPGDEIVEVNGLPAVNRDHIIFDKGKLELIVLRDGERVVLPAFEPRSIGVHPTQIYETISMLLLMGFLLSYFPYRRRRGELMVFLMFGYGVHRFLNEMLRTDNEVVAFGLTLSQNVSILVLIAGVILAIIVYRRPPIADEPPPPTLPTTTTDTLAAPSASGTPA